MHEHPINSSFVAVEEADFLGSISNFNLYSISKGMCNYPTNHGNIAEIETY